MNIETIKDYLFLNRISVSLGEIIAGVLFILSEGWVAIAVTFLIWVAVGGYSHHRTLKQNRKDYQESLDKYTEAMEKGMESVDDRK